MKKVVLLVVLLAALAAPVARADTVSLLFSLDARTAVVTQSGQGYRLAVPTATALVWFSDRPKRLAGHTTLPALVRSWARFGFDKDPPNAALLLRGRTSGPARQHVVELTRPRVRGAIVTFEARELPEGSAAGRRHTHSIRPGTYGRAELFIDNATATMGCTSSCVIF